MPDDARELQTIRPASHTTALGELFIADVWAEAQGDVYEVGSEPGSSSCSDAGLGRVCVATGWPTL